MVVVVVDDEGSVPMEAVEEESAGEPGCFLDAKSLDEDKVVSETAAKLDGM